MAKKLQLRRGTTSQHSSFTGAVGEVTVDTDKDVLVVHDGSTAGGHASVKSGAVAAADLASNAVTTAKIAADAVTDAKIAADSVGASELKVTGNGTSGQYLGSDADGTFTWTSISSDPSMGGDMSGTASNAQIVANAVTTTEINADAVTGAKIADNAIDSEHYTDGSIDTAHIANSQITTALLADSSVNSAKIVDGSIATGDIANDAVTGAKIPDDAIGAEHIAQNSIVADSIQNSSVVSSKIADGAITNAKLASNSVNAVKIWAGGTANSGTFLRGDMQWAAATPGSASVAKATLKTSTEEKTASYSGGPQTLHFSSAADYAFVWNSKVNVNNKWFEFGGNPSNTIGTTYVNKHQIQTHINPMTAYMRMRYIQASPPYDLGDGAVHTFIYAILENGSGKIKRMSLAQDPPWVYNSDGGLDRGCFYDDDKTKKRYYKRNKIVDYSKIKDIEEFKELVGQTELIEYDMKLKMENMCNVPHPFMDDVFLKEPEKGVVYPPSENREDTTYWSRHHVVLIDPVDDVTQRLDCISECGESALALFDEEKPYLTIDNDDITNRGRPHSDKCEHIMVHKAKWKNS